MFPTSCLRLLFFSANSALYCSNCLLVVSVSLKKESFSVRRAINSFVIVSNRSKIENSFKKTRREIDLWGSESGRWLPYPGEFGAGGPRAALCGGSSSGGPFSRRRAPRLGTPYPWPRLGLVTGIQWNYGKMWFWKSFNAGILVFIEEFHFNLFLLFSSP